MAKAESSLATQIRTEKDWIGSVFLHQRKSPRDLHGLWLGRGRQTAKDGSVA